MKVFFTVILILVGALAVVGQQAQQIVLATTPADCDTTVAPNVSIGPYTITVVYPEIEFRLYFSEHKIRVSDTGDNPREQVLDAVVSQASGLVYRADVGATGFLEINAATGTTFLHQLCHTRVWAYDPAWQSTAQH